MAKPLAVTLIWGVLCAAAGLCQAQEVPPSAVSLPKTARDGMRLVEDRQYRQAIEYLVRASNEGSKAAIIEEYLVTAYLNVPPSADIKDMLRGAQEAARRAIDYGGCAPFIVDRSTSSRFDRNFADGERGRLRVCKDRLEYQAARSTTTFTITPGDISEFGFNRFKGETKAAFHIKTKSPIGGKKSFDFRPASFSEREPDLMFELMTELWQIRPTL